MTAYDQKGSVLVFLVEPKAISAYTSSLAPAELICPSTPRITPTVCKTDTTRRRRTERENFHLLES